MGRLETGKTPCEIHDDGGEKVMIVRSSGLITEVYNRTLIRMSESTTDHTDHTSELLKIKSAAY